MDKDLTGRLGVSTVENLCSKHGWCFREQTILDKGIDALIEFINDNNESINLIALQIKSGISYFSETDENNFVFRFDQDHKTYWETFRIPVVLVLYNPATNELFYQLINKETTIKSGYNYKILIPKGSRFEDFLDSEALVLKKIPDYIYNYDYMLSQLPLMKAIMEGIPVILKGEEWINKSSGRGHIYLEIHHKDFIEELHWNYWYPFQPYQDVFQRLLPWASFKPDEDYYKNYDREAWNETNYYRIIKGEREISFNEYARALSPMRGVIKAGEVAFYKLHLSINDFGKSFYLTHQNLLNLNVYKGIRISSSTEYDLIEKNK